MYRIVSSFKTNQSIANHYIFSSVISNYLFRWKTPQLTSFPIKGSQNLNFKVDDVRRKLFSFRNPKSKDIHLIK